MASRTADVVVAGHICLDIIPEFDTAPDSLEQLLQPGRLTEVGPAAMVPGGAVSNTGLGLHRLGLSAQLVGKVGGDLIGEATVDHLRQKSGLRVNEVVRAEESSSYTIVISPPGMDRSFFHSPGPNQTFRPDEIPRDDLVDAPLFYFGYPPLLRKVFIDGGEQLARLFRDVRGQGMAVTMDMAMPDPNAKSGRVDWDEWLTRVLPEVDIFTPSLEEILFMLERPVYDRKTEQGADGDFSSRIATEILDRISEKLVERGVPMVVLKLGGQGLYLRTAQDTAPFRQLSDALTFSADRWTGRQLLLPAFDTDVVGTTGAGDAAVAGLLAGLRRGLGPEEALRGAVAVGTCSVEAPDASQGIPDWSTVQARLDAGWEQQALRMEHPSWVWSEKHALWGGPEDRVSKGMVT